MKLFLQRIYVRLVQKYLFLARSYIEEGLDNKNLSLSKKNKDTLIRLQSELDCYIRREAT